MGETNNNDNISRYTKDQLATLVKNFGEVFEVARLVDVSMTHQLALTEDGTDFEETTYSCYAVWNKNRRCENCVSAKAFTKKTKMTKFEFVDDEIYYVVAKYVEMDGVPYMLELVTKIDDDTLFGAYGKDAFAKKITEYNEKLYVDPLTHAYNRSYYNEQLAGLSKVSGIAMMDLDKFKDINDTFGHDAGDAVLQGVVDVVQRSIRSTDAVIRYGGDEFIIVFKGITQEIFNNRLSAISKAVTELRLPDYPEVRVTVSIGGYFCEDDQSIAALKRADDLLYEAKQDRNTVVCA